MTNGKNRLEADHVRAKQTKSFIGQSFNIIECISGGNCMNTPNRSSFLGAGFGSLEFLGPVRDCTSLADGEVLKARKSLRESNSCLICGSLIFDDWSCK